MKSPSPNSPKSPAPDALTFALEDMVRRKYAPEEIGMIIGVVFRIGASPTFLVSWGDETEEHEHHSEELKFDEGFER